MHLAPCPACARHVRLDAATCPFCDGPVPSRKPRAARPVQNLTRAAIVYLGAVLASGCGPEAGGDEVPETPREDTVLQPYGAPPDPEPEPVPEPEPEVEPEAEPPDEPPTTSTGRGSVAQPYGASPSPRDNGLEELLDE